MALNQFGFSSRFECKYLLPAFKAEEVRRVLPFYMRLDPFCKNVPKHQYMCSSLYFDSLDSYCYRTAYAGEKNRFKLRARWYHGAGAPPVVFEEKRRTADVISKSRILLKDGMLNHYLQGQRLRERDFQTTNETLAESHRLGERVRRLNAVPACFVRYHREAWTGDVNEYLRVTFDTELQAHELVDEVPDQEAPGWVDVDLPKTIVEVKFERAIPAWLQDVIRTYEMHRVSVPKYMLCMDRLYGALAHQGVAEHQPFFRRARVAG